MPNGFEIDFLPVGDKSCSGDSICLHYGNAVAGYKIHIVDGGFASTTEKIIAHLANYYGRPRRVENVVLTHSDNDHASGLIGILEQYEVGALWMNRPWLYSAEIVHHFHGNWTVPGLTAHLRSEYSTLITLENIATRKGIPIYSPLQGANIGPFTVLAPSRERYLGILPALEKTPETYTTKSAVDWFSDAVKKVVTFVRESWSGESLTDRPVPTSAANESSVVHAARIEDRAIVLTGDVGPAGLAEAADYAEQFAIFRPNFFQVPHHGSRRNVTPTVLNRWLGNPLPFQTSPTRGIAFCSAAEDDDEHPRKKVENAFLRRGYPVHSTKGQVKRHCYNMPPRPGWVSSVPAAFQAEVEE